MKKITYSSRSAKAIIWILIIAFPFTSCKKEGTPGANEVWMQSIAFNPSSLTVAVNTTVTWTNKDNVQHTVTSDSGWFDSGLISPGGDLCPAVYRYGNVQLPVHCSFKHEWYGDSALRWESVPPWGGTMSPDRRVGAHQGEESIVIK